MTIKRILILFALVILAMAAIARASAQDVAKVELPEAPAVTNNAISRPAVPVHQPWMTRLEMVDAAGILATRTLDYVSTEGFLARGVPEGELPNGLVHGPKFLLYSEGIAASEIVAEHYFDRSRLARHRVARIAARAGIEASIALLAKTDIGNFQAQPAAPLQRLEFGHKILTRR